MDLDLHHHDLDYFRGSDHNFKCVHFVLQGKFYRKPADFPLR